MASFTARFDDDTDEVTERVDCNGDRTTELNSNVPDESNDSDVNGVNVFDG